MMRYLICLLLTACYFSNEEMLAHSPSLHKQRQKIALLQKKLADSQKEESQLKEQTAALCAQIEEAQIALVKRAIVDMKHRLLKLRQQSNGTIKKGSIDVATLFIQEREILHRLIESGPSPVALEAQGLLDQVLRLITTLGDETAQLSTRFP